VEESMLYQGTHNIVHAQEYLLGDGSGWIIKPGEVWVSKKAKLAVYPSGKGYKVNLRRRKFL
jgi:hypothetical protein